MPGAAFAVHGSSGTRKTSALRGDHGRGDGRGEPWNVVVWDLAFLRTPLFKLAFNFEQLVHVRAELLVGTVTRSDVSIRPTCGTETLAICLAQRLHRQREQNLLPKNISERQLRAAEKRSACVFFRQFDFVFVEHLLIAFAKEKIERF
jgi:hypothetical protein